MKWWRYIIYDLDSWLLLLSFHTFNFYRIPNLRRMMTRIKTRRRIRKTRRIRIKTRTRRKEMGKKRKTRRKMRRRNKQPMIWKQIDNFCRFVTLFNDFTCLFNFFCYIGVWYPHHIKFERYLQFCKIDHLTTANFHNSKLYLPKILV